MAELILRDLCRWDRRFVLACPPGLSEESALKRPISWAISVRAAPPFLPPPRGDELVILSGRILREIQASGLAEAEDLLDTLAEAPIAALVTEPNLIEEPVGSLPLLLFPGPLPLDLESTLNRLLTEQRRALYRLSTELTRELSRAALSGGLDAVLQAAALASNRSLLLQDSEGRLLAAAGPTPTPAPPTALAQARPHPATRLLSESLGERLLTAITAGGRVAYLSLLAVAGETTERDRLVLSLLAGLCASLLAQESRTARPTPSSQLVADLLLGRVSESTLPLVAQRLGLGPNQPVIVALFAASGEPEAAERVLRRILEPSARDRSTPLGDTLALLLTEDEAAAVEDRARSAIRPTFPERLTLLPPRFAAPSVRSQPAWFLVFAEPVPHLRAVPQGLRQARFLAGLIREGALPGPIARFDALADTGPFAFLYALWGENRATDLARSLLGPLLEEDERAQELLRTLAAFLACGSASEVAAHLGIHRNTVAYRLAQISELTGRNLADPRDRLLLHLALLLVSMPPAEPPAAQ